MRMLIISSGGGGDGRGSDGGRSRFIEENAGVGGGECVGWSGLDDDRLGPSVSVVWAIGLLGYWRDGHGPVCGVSTERDLL